MIRSSDRRRTAAGLVAATGLVSWLLVPTGASAHADPSPGSLKSWQRYVVAPPDRHVEPVAVGEPTGQVTDPNGLLADGGGVTVLRREPPTPAPRWPGGTTATASSYHAGNNGNDGRPRTYDPGNAIDGDLDTFWNDDTFAAYPDVLTVTSPSPVTLPGVTLRSNADGPPRDFVVDVWNGTDWARAGAVSGNTAVQVAVRFAAPVTTTQVRVTVTKSAESSRGEFTRVNELWPGIVETPAAPSVTVDFGKVVVGYPRIRFAGSSGVTDGAPGVRLAFSESRQYLTDRSDFTRSDFSGGPGTDQYAVPAAGATWTDTKSCQYGDKVCADGLHGFRYLRISLDALESDAPHARPYGEVRIDSVALDFTAYLGTPDTFAGWFESSDARLNQIWYGSAYTNELTTDTFRASDVEPRDAATAGLEGKVVLHDGPKRDRDPYVGDIAVQGRTEYLTHAQGAPARNVLADLADHQRADGFIPPASILNYGLQLFDYPLWWVTSSWDYVLYTGDLDYGRAHYANLVKVLDTWYPSVTNDRGLLEKGLNGTGGYGDYAFLPRGGEVTYYNVNYVRALRNAASLAAALGHASDGDRWRARADQVAGAVNAHLWDDTAGAYLDSSSGAVRHAQDGNAIAIVAGVAGPDRGGRALDHLAAATARPWGNAFMDNDTLFGGSSQRVYAFTSYPELEARFRLGRDASALEQIRRTYGWMLDHDPGTTFWEGIGPDGSLYEGPYTSLAHGWSTGALPALTNYALGVLPQSPGFARWSVQPRPGDLTWTRGQVPTPHGALGAAWQRDAERSRFTLTVTAPRGTSGQVAVPTFGAKVGVRVDGRLVWNGSKAKAPGVTVADGYVTVDGIGPGSHVITVRPADEG